jgi:hypothetical protein
MRAMCDSHFQFLAAQIDAYARSIEETDPGAFECWDLHFRLRVGVTLHAAIAELDERLAAEALAGQLPYDRTVSERIRKLYADWERPSARMVPRLKELWSKGCQVETGDEFKSAVLDARSMLTLSLDQLDESARQLKAGMRRSMAEVVDGVRRRMGA